MSETKNIRRSLAWWHVWCSALFQWGFASRLTLSNALRVIFARTQKLVLLATPACRGVSEGKPCSNMCITNKDRPAGELPNCFGGGLFWFVNFDGDSYKLAGNVGNGLLTLRKWNWHRVSSCKVLVCVCVDVVIFQVTRPGDVIPHKRVFLEHAISHNCLSGDIFVFEGVLLLSMYMHVVGNRMPGFCFSCFYVEFPCFMVWNSLISGRYNPAKSTA